jgi:acyl-[acyl-carrier-protein]-phospholipid O-acyltransferase/long-chain-fatty-acid--[acyl-carrier-protein] ligase
MSRDRAAAPTKSFPWRCYEETLRLLFKAYLKAVHRIRIEGIERVPKAFDKLIVIANHASYLDGIILWAYLRLPLRIVVDRTIASNPWLAPFLKNDCIVPIDFMSPYALKDIVRMVDEGLPLLVFPEGRRTSTGHFMKLYDGAGFVASRTGAPILPVYLKGTYDTFFARKHKGRRIFAPVVVTIGGARPPLGLGALPSRKRKGAATRMIYSMLCDLRLEAHNKPSTLGREFIRICSRDRGRTLFGDSTGAKVSRRKALLGALALGRRLSQIADGKVAIMLPNLAVTAVVFMAMQLYRKAPAFLNYSSGPRGLELAMELADIGTVITSRQFLEKLRLTDAVFGPRKCIFLEDLKGEVGTGDKLAALFRTLFPGPFGRMRPGEEKDTAVILFTSGSEAAPKGVCLSHENIITNVHQGLSRIGVTQDDSFLNVLPMFHSFGLTAGTIIPMFAGARAFFHVSPLHYRIVPELAYDNECTILPATNTFLNGYGRRANPYDFRSLRYIFCGGEALTDAVFERYAKAFGIRVMTGYGATECAPLVSLNTDLQYEYGTVGALLPGMEKRIVRVEGIDDKGGTVGRLLVRGKNVMKGYLKNEAANRKYLVEDGGWYDTGDIVEVTEEGALKILGRLRRFAKVSGEMISLAAVEEVLARELAGRKDLAVMAVADEKKGESLIVVTNNPGIEIKSVRDALKERGFSELAIPRRVVYLKEIPKLGTGKIDYVRLQEILG